MDCFSINIQHAFLLVRFALSQLNVTHILKKPNCMTIFCTLYQTSKLLQSWQKQLQQQETAKQLTSPHIVIYSLNHHVHGHTNRMQTQRLQIQTWSQFHKDVLVKILSQFTLTSNHSYSIRRGSSDPNCLFYQSLTQYNKNSSTFNFQRLFLVQFNRHIVQYPNMGQFFFLQLILKH